VIQRRRVRPERGKRYIWQRVIRYVRKYLPRADGRMTGGGGDSPADENPSGIFFLFRVRSRNRLFRDGRLEAFSGR